MNKKYLLRGIGIGLIIGVLVTYTAFKTGDYKTGDQDPAAGKTESSSVIADRDKTDQTTEGTKTEEPKSEGQKTEEPKSEGQKTENPKTEDLKTEDIKTEEPKTEKQTTEEPKTEKPTTEEPKTEKPTTEEPTTEKQTTEEPKTEKQTTEEPKTEEPKTEKQTTEEPKTEQPKTDKPAGDTVQVTVVAGMSSDKIASLVQDAGLIKDYRDFDSWLGRNGYDRILRVGTFTLKKGMSYEEIAKILTNSGN